VAEKTAERVLDLENGISIWKVHLDNLREQYKNARFMPPKKFERLVENIKADGRLESLPLCVYGERPNGSVELQIISGHHRVRAARSAGITEIYAMVLDSKLSEDQIKSKQLAHNALSGDDDRQILAEIYNSIEDIQARIASGVFVEDININFDPVNVDDIKLDVDFEAVNFSFLSEKKKEFEDVINLIITDKDVYVSDLKNFENFKKAVQTLSKAENVRNIGAIIARMNEIVLNYYKERKNVKDNKADKN